MRVTRGASVVRTDYMAIRATRVDPMTVLRAD
jgi:hypothetical protein